MSIPNILTIIRLLLIPVFIWLFKTSHITWSLIVFIIASITDVLDGYIARRYNMVTWFGKLLDPLADKLMLVAVLICLVMDNRIPLWALVLVCAKELVMLTGALILLKKGNVVSANIFGKITTALFGLAVVSAFIFPPGSLVTKIVLYISLALTGVSVVSYGMSAVRFLKNEEKRAA